MIHTIFHFSLASFYAGMYAMVSLSVSRFVRNKLVPIVSGFIIRTEMRFYSMGLVFSVFIYGFRAASGFVAGAGIDEVQKGLVHSDINTMNIYTHMTKT